MRDLLRMAAAVSSICAILAARPSVSAPTSTEGASPATVLFAVHGPASAQRFRDPLSITCDPATGEIFVADTGNHEIAIFDSDGTPRFRFTHYIENGTPGGPRCAAQTRDGRILITDAFTTAISVANSRGEVLQRLDPALLVGLPGRRVVPGYFATGKDGRIYVTISGDAAGVLVLDASLSPVRFYNGRSPDKGELTSPTGIAVDDDGRVFVADPNSALAVSFFSPEGEFLGGFGRHDSGRDNFSFPSGICLIDGAIWVGDSLRQVVKGMDEGGHLITMLGGRGTKPGEMLYPVSVASDGARRLYVLERVGARFQAFEPAAMPTASF